MESTARTRTGLSSAMFLLEPEQRHASRSAMTTRLSSFLSPCNICPLLSESTYLGFWVYQVRESFKKAYCLSLYGNYVSHNWIFPGGCMSDHFINGIIMI